MIEALLNDLAEDEEFVPHVYKDSEGYDTIGYGTLVDRRLGAGITEEEARFLMVNRVKVALRELSAAVPWWLDLPEGPRRALANMAYNLGLPRLMKFRKMLAALEARDFGTAAAEALDSKWARQVGERADRLAAMIAKGEG